jgi:prefoldin subunit 5
MRKSLINCVILLFFITVSYPLLAQENLPSIIKKIQPSVVTILTYDEKGKGLMQGSGFFVGQDGDIITSRHVLQGAGSAYVKTAQGKVYPVTRLVVEDKEGDLILISVNISHDTVQPLSLSASIPEVGERVLVIGSPLGLEKTVSDGIVSAVRDIPEFGKIIQITAPISPGSSGSPLVNMKGEVIGVAALQKVGGQNLNFAISGVRVARLVPDKRQTPAQDTAESTSDIYKWVDEKGVEHFSDSPPPNKEAEKLQSRSIDKIGGTETIPPKASEGHSDSYINNQISSLEESIKNYEKEINKCEEDIKGYQQEIKKLEQMIWDLPRFYSNHNAGDYYDSLRKSYESSIEHYKSMIKDKQNQSYELSSKIVDLKNELHELRSEEVSTPNK